MQKIRSALLLTFALSLLACPAARPADEPSGDLNTERAANEEGVEARVVSNVEYQLRVYVESDVQSVFMGSLQPLGTATYRVPAIVLAGRAQIRMRAEPVGPRGRYLSDWVHVQEGDLVEWRVFGSPR